MPEGLGILLGGAKSDASRGVKIPILTLHEAARIQDPKMGGGQAEDVTETGLLPVLDPFNQQAA